MCVVSKGTSVVPIILNYLMIKKSIGINSVIRSKYLFTAGVLQMMKMMKIAYVCKM